MDNVESFVFENRMRLISDGKIKEYHIMAYYKERLK